MVVLADSVRRAIEFLSFPPRASSGLGKQLARRLQLLFFPCIYLPGSAS